MRMKVRAPKRSRTASATVCRLTAASLPHISVRKIKHNVPSATDHNNWNRNLAPACADVAIEPTSRKPPMLVAMPSAISPHFFIGFLSAEGAGALRLPMPIVEWNGERFSDHRSPPLPSDPRLLDGR